MLERQKRLNEVYEHLHNHFGIHTKGEFADAVKYARAYISSALNGNEDYLTDKLFKNICAAYEGVFRLEYLLNGEGDLLTIEEQVKVGEIEECRAPGTQNIPDYIQRMFDENVRISTQNEILQRELSRSLADNHAMKEKLDQAITSVEGMKQQLAALLQVFNNPNAIQLIHQMTANESASIR